MCQRLRVNFFQLTEQQHLENIGEKCKAGYENIDLCLYCLQCSYTLALKIKPQIHVCTSYTQNHYSVC